MLSLCQLYHPRCEATESDPDADCIFGSAGQDYPILARVPDTGFGCGDLLPGIYADMDAACQVILVANKFLERHFFME